MEEMRRIRKPDPPLRDVFAAQWLIAVLIGLFFCCMQLFAPEICGAMLDALYRIAEESPAITLPDLHALLTQWT